MIRELGAFALDLITKIGDLVLSLPRILRGLLNRLSSIKRYGISWRSGISIPVPRTVERAVLALQITSLAFLAVLLLRIALGIDLRILIISLAILSMIHAFLLRTSRDVFSEDYPAYRFFFTSYPLIILVSLAIYEIAPAGSLYPIPQNALSAFLIAGMLVLIFQAYFKRKFGRDYTKGIVLRASGGYCTIRTSYDIRANVTPGEHVIECSIDVDEGDLVEVELEKSKFSLRGRKPIRVVRVLSKASRS